MWLVEEVDQGYFKYCLYKNKPIMETTFPTERTCCVDCINYEDAGYICDIPESVIDNLPFIVNCHPIEIDVKLGNDLYGSEEEENKTFKQIEFNSRLLKGKTIKDIRIHNDSNICSGHILIIFNDNTYTIIGLEEVGNLDYEYIVRFISKHEHFLTEYGQQDYIENPLKFGHVKDDGTYCIDSRYKDYVEAGIVNIPNEIINTAVEQRQKQLDDIEYQQYLKLKEKYEGKRTN